MGALIPPPGQPLPLAPGEFVQSAPANLIQFRTSNLDPPSALYIQRDDVLIVTGMTFTPGDVITVQIRLLVVAPDQPGQPESHGAPEGVTPVAVGQPTIKTLATQFSLPAALTAATQVFQLAEGYLLSILLGGGTNVKGSTFARAVIKRGASQTLPSFASLSLCSGQVGSNYPIGWPGGENLTSTDGQGFFQPTTVANPAAGADWTYTQPVNSRARVQSVAALLTTSAAVANRNVQVVIKDNLGDVVYQAAAQQSLAASLAGRASFAGIAIASTLAPVTLNIPIPPNLTLEGAWTLNSATTNLQAGDQWSAIFLNLEQWLEGI